MPQLVITSLPVRLLVALAVAAAAFPGSARPMERPGVAVQLPEPPALVIAPPNLAGQSVPAFEGDSHARPSPL